MAPNLYIAMRTLVTPTQWFPNNKKRSGDKDSLVVSGQPLARTEHRNDPVPGVYKLVPGLGWFLIQSDANPALPEKPERVVMVEPYGKLLEKDYQARIMKAKLPKECTPASSRAPSPSRRYQKETPPNSKAGSQAASRRGSREESPPQEVTFFRMDDGMTWVVVKDHKGRTTYGPFQRFVLDKSTGEMRIMTKGDDPAQKNKANVHTSRPASLKSGASHSVASSIKAIAPELDAKPAQEPAFLGPRSLAGSSRGSSRNSLDVSRPTSIRMPSDRSMAKSPLASPSLAQMEVK